MSPRASVWITIILCAVGVIDGRAQTASLEQGDRVRISIANLEATSQWRTGRLSSLDSTSITIVEARNGRSLSLPLKDLDQVQASLGRDTGRGVRWIGGGAAFGFVVGAGLTLSSRDEVPNGSSSSWITAGLGFAAVGGVVGGIIGFQEQWGDVVLQLEPTASVRVEPLLRASVSF